MSWLLFFYIHSIRTLLLIKSNTFHTLFEGHHYEDTIKVWKQSKDKMTDKLQLTNLTLPPDLPIGDLKDIIDQAWNGMDKNFTHIPERFK